MLNKYLSCALLTIAVLFTATKTYSQEKEIPKDLYVASTTPDSLKENANSVVRYYRTDMVVKGPGKSVTKRHIIVAILNEKGEHEAELVLPYNKKYSNFNSIEMRVYDDKGVVIKKYHKSDMYDGSATSGENLVTDERFLAVRHTVASFPTTIEYEFEEDNSSLLD